MRLSLAFRHTVSISLLGLALLLPAAGVMAQPGARTAAATLAVTLKYQAGAECPSEATFVAGLRRLCPALDVRPPMAVTPRELVVGLKRRAGQFVGTLAYGDVSREVKADACADAAYALALIAAITLDPEASVAQSDVAPQDFAEPTTALARAETAPVETAEVSQPADAKPIQEREPLPTAKASSQALSHDTATADTGTWTTWLGPMLAVGEFGGTSFDAVSWSAELAVLRRAPEQLGSFLLSVRGATGRRELEVTTLEHLRIGLGLQWCPRLTAGAESPWQWFICGGVEGGWSRVSTSTTARFAAVGSLDEAYASALLETLLSVSLNSTWALAVHPAVALPLLRNEYVVESAPGVDVRVVRHARLVGTAAIQVGYAF